MTLIEAFEPRGGGDGDKAYRSEYTEQRPPVYNAEDYSVYLRKHSKLTGLQLYINSAQDNSGKCLTLEFCGASHTLFPFKLFSGLHQLKLPVSIDGPI